MIGGTGEEREGVHIMISCLLHEINRLKADATFFLIYDTSIPDAVVSGAKLPSLLHPTVKRNKKRNRVLIPSLSLFPHFALQLEIRKQIWQNARVSGVGNAFTWLDLHCLLFPSLLSHFTLHSPSAWRFALSFLPHFQVLKTGEQGERKKRTIRLIHHPTLGLEKWWGRQF